MKLKIILTNEVYEFEKLQIFHDITLDSFKYIIKNNPELMLKMIEDLESKISSSGNINSDIKHTPFVYCGIVE